MSEKQKAARRQYMKRNRELRRLGGLITAERRRAREERSSAEPGLDEEPPTFEDFERAERQRGRR